MSERRQGFNFYRAYMDVYENLSKKDRVAFIDALLMKQFYGVEPSGLNEMVNFAYVSQKNVIDRQVKGYEDKTGHKLSPPNEGEVKRVVKTPNGQEKEEGEEEVKVKAQEKEEYILEVKVKEINKEKNILSTYGAKQFLRYWTEKPDTKNGGKERWERQKTWNTQGRMIKWAENNYSGKCAYKKPSDGQPKFSNPIL